MRIKAKDLHKIESFQKEKDKFYLLSLIATAENPLIISDLDTYIIGRSEEGLPTWIWTVDDINEEKTKELQEELNHFLLAGNNKITCKKELYDLLKDEYDTNNYFEMGYLSCTEPINPEKGKGIFVKPNYGDKVTLAEYWRDNTKELYKKSLTQREALEEVEKWYEEKQFYVLKNNVGDIVCMAGYSTVGDSAKITHVYTPVEERRKGFCQYLIYSLAKKLIEEGYKPLLYTDYKYASSNRAYQKVGFIDEGILINFNIEK